LTTAVTQGELPLDAGTRALAPIAEYGRTAYWAVTDVYAHRCAVLLGGRTCCGRPGCQEFFLDRVRRLGISPRLREAAFVFWCPG
jgi:hypothetical protein